MQQQLVGECLHASGQNAEKLIFDILENSPTAYSSRRIFAHLFRTHSRSYIGTGFFVMLLGLLSNLTVIYRAVSTVCILDSTAVLYCSSVPAVVCTHNVSGPRVLVKTGLIVLGIILMPIDMVRATRLHENYSSNFRTGTS